MLTQTRIGVHPCRGNCLHLRPVPMTVKYRKAVDHLSAGHLPSQVLRYTQTQAPGLSSQDTNTLDLANLIRKKSFQTGDHCSVLLMHILYHASQILRTSTRVGNDFLCTDRVDLPALSICKLKLMAPQENGIQTLETDYNTGLQFTVNEGYNRNTIYLNSFSGC
jgi:hypothetical protein